MAYADVIFEAKCPVAALSFDDTNITLSSESNLPYKAYEALSDDYDPGQDTAGQDDAGHDVTSLESMKHTITMEVSL